MLVTSPAVILSHMPHQKLQDGKHSVYTSRDTVAASNSGSNKQHIQHTVDRQRPHLQALILYIVL